jgi:Ca2+-binding EF-hand superfamily protein
MVDRVAREAGMDTTQPISLVRLQESLQQMRDRRLGGPGTTPGETPASRGNTTRTDTTKPAAPTIPGFGAEFETIVVPGFGETLAVTSSGTLASTSSTSATPTSSEADRRSRGDSPRDRDDEERGGRGRGRGGDRGFDRRGEGERGDDNNRRSEPVAAAVSSTSTTTPSTASPSRGGNENDRIRRIAQAMLSRYDENKDGTLQREEWSKMSNEPEKGDKNGDGQITLDEMAERLGEWRPSSSSSSSGGSSSASGSSSSSASSGQASPGAGGRSGRGDFGGRGRGRGGFGSREQSASRPTTTASGQSYRFLTPKERLPEDVPSFFSSDRDGDGQVSMAEFSSSWDDAKLAEFNRWDLNRDGVITAAETRRAGSR